MLRLALLDEKAQGRAESVERLKSLRRLAEDRLKPDLEAVEGSAAVKVSGGYEDEVQVFVDQQKLAQLGLSIDVVTRRIRAENVNLSGGRLEQGTQRFLVRTLNEFETVEQMANAIIATRGRPADLPASDVATVTRGYKDREAITRVNGQEAIELAVYKEGDANTVQLADGVRARVKELEKGLPEGTVIRAGLRPVDVHRRRDQRGQERRTDRRPARDPGALRVPARCARDADLEHRDPGLRARHVRADVRVRPHAQHHVARRHRACGRHARRQRGRRARERRAQPGKGRNPARGGARSARPKSPGAVFAATLTSVAVFAPMVFITGIAGQLFKDQSLTVTFALSFSLLVALTLVPMLAAGRVRAAAAASTRRSPVKPAGRVGARPGRLPTAVCDAPAAGFRAAAHWSLSPLVNVTQAANHWADRKYPPAITLGARAPGQDDRLRRRAVRR